MRNMYFLCAIFLLATASPPEAKTLALNSDIDSFLASNLTVFNANKPRVSQTPIRARRKRYITQIDMVEILDYHNQVRANVFPPAANMEYMVWDNDLARTAEAWAATCWWDHGPAYLLQFYGQNLSVRTGRYTSIVQLVEPWFDEVKDYAFPYPGLCNPACPLLCYGPMCTHYTQMVWATTNRVGCAVQTCANMLVWGALWREATYLVCNYSPKGNWVGEAPYRVGVPCSSCPPGYGGSCRNNMCSPPAQSNFMHWFK
ncbi:peptidase inhibitor 15-like [Gadus macrocephalus]|uniref:peptidase inhibitor 15-like n=1 Tax=Gadus macrocephalus TaxID=80720 RepID=UPI0028CB922E|nr:peptidase inhibitor 15-like [Gadus macrocephalus]